MNTTVIPGEGKMLLIDKCCRNAYKWETHYLHSINAPHVCTCALNPWEARNHTLVCDKVLYYFTKMIGDPFVVSKLDSENDHNHGLLEARKYTVEGRPRHLEAPKKALPLEI